MSSKFAWNKYRTRSVVLAKLKEFGITDKFGNVIDPDKPAPNDCKEFHAKGWFNKENSFDFGIFESVDKAREFIEKVHKLL